MLLINSMLSTYRYRAPKPKQSKDDEYGNQPTLMENILDNCHQKVIGLNERYEKYRNDPAAAKGIKTW